MRNIWFDSIDFDSNQFLEKSQYSNYWFHSFQIKDKLDCVESKQSVKRRFNNILRNKMSQVTRVFLKDNDRLLRKLELKNTISNFNRRLKLNLILLMASLLAKIWVTPLIYSFQHCFSFVFLFFYLFHEFRAKLFFAFLGFRYFS